MSQITALSAAKGGVGVSQLTANLGAALSKLERRTLLVDAHFGARTLDLFTGLSTRVFYHAGDVLNGRASLEDALLPVDGFHGLFLLPAGLREEDAENLTDGLLPLCERSFDQILIDLPLQPLTWQKSLLARCSDIVLVTTPEQASVRRTDSLRTALEAEGVRPQMIVNMIRPRLIKKGLLTDAWEATETLPMQVLARVPSRRAVLVAGERGELLAGSASDYGLATMNAARRLLGEEVPYAV